MMTRTLWVGVLLLLTTTIPAWAGPARPSDAFRREHAEIQKHLDQARQWVGEIPRLAPPDQKAKAEQVVAFFANHIVPHAEWEEARLYPLVDKLAGTSEANRFTASMRYEHRIVGRWVGELKAALRADNPDYVAFARRADNLIGLVAAHFEEEEEVLLPIIDAKMTAEEFSKATQDGGGSAHRQHEK